MHESGLVRTPLAGVADPSRELSTVREYHWRNCDVQSAVSTSFFEAARYEYVRATTT